MYRTFNPGQAGVQVSLEIGSFRDQKSYYVHMFQDLRSGYLFTRVFEGQNPLNSAQLLNDEVLPFYEKHGFELDTVFTEFSPEYCGAPAHHPFQLFTSLWGIEQSSENFQSIYTCELAPVVQRLERELFTHVVGQKSAVSLEKLSNLLEVWTNMHNHYASRGDQSSAWHKMQETVCEEQLCAVG